jgi:hypothetical protein
VPCNAKSTTEAGPPSLTVNPATCLDGGTSVTVTGSGFDKSSPGNVLECNSDKGQPTVSLLGQTVPVSCTGINISKLVTTDASGNVSSTFSVVDGTTGPPCGASPLQACPATDSSGGNPVTDAAKYPCPPTSAQATAGDTCSVSYGDAGGKQQSVTITFRPNAVAGGGSSSTTPATTAAQAAAAAAATQAAAAAAANKAATSPSTLAFTGAGPGTWYTLLGGLLLLDLGFLILTLYYRPREMAEMLSRGVRKTFGGK